MTRFDVVIPAGGTIDDAYAQVIGTPYRALAPLGLGGPPVLQRIVETLRATETVRRVIVVAPTPVQQAVSGVDRWLPAGASGAANVLLGLTEAAPDAPCLICTSDLPLLTGDAVAAFVSQVQPEAELAVGVVRADAYSVAYPDAPPSEFVRLSDVGPVTLAGTFVVHPRLVLRNQTLFDGMFRARKAQWRMAGLLGPGLLWGWATKTLSLGALTRRAERLLGGPVQAVLDVPPALAYDIDTADDYTYALVRLGHTPPAPRRDASE